MVPAACILLALAAAAYVFWPQRVLAEPTQKPRLDYLRERAAVLAENLRDLGFERDAGKYRDEEYTRERASLQAEADTVEAEMETLAGRRGHA